MMYEFESKVYNANDPTLFRSLMYHWKEIY